MHVHKALLLLRHAANLCACVLFCVFFVQIAIALCGSFKYAEVKSGGVKDEGMDLAMMAEACCYNYAGEKDEGEAITNALYPPLVRYDPSTSGASQGFIDVWGMMDLSKLFGFPLWEEDVFFALYGAFNELQSIFAMYAKSNASGSASASQALTMQQTELTDLALDCSLATDAFPMARVVLVFESADAVKDQAALKKGAKPDGALEVCNRAARLPLQLVARSGLRPIVVRRCTACT